jgi:pilus assembly protein CpaB
MTRRTRGLVVFGVAVAMATLASAAVNRAIKERGAEARAETQSVVVAARTLPAGARLTKDDVKTIAWPKDAAIDGAFSSVDDVAGQGLTSAVALNEPLTRNKVAAPGTGAGMPPTIPPGMRAISVKVDEVVSVAGFAVSGSRVDVVVALGGAQESIARAVASNVQVLAVGTRNDVEQSKDYRSGATVVTLLVSPSDAERISLASMQGRITLTLRNPLDTGVASPDGVRLASLVGQRATPVAHRPDPRLAEPAPPPTPRVHTVETIRAGKRTEENVR